MAAKTKIIIVGAGFGGVYTARELCAGFYGDPWVEIGLVNPHNYFLFAPLLHEVATGHQARENIVEPLRRVLPNAEIYLTHAESIDPVRQVVKTSGCDIEYDYLVLALGSDTNFFGVPGAAEHSLTLKSLADASALKNRLIENLERANYSTDASERAALLNLAVVGGGPTGVELAAEIAEFLYYGCAKLYRNLAIVDLAKITLIQAGAELIPQFTPALRRQALLTLRQKKIDVRLLTKVTAVAENWLELNGQEKISTQTVIWAAGIKARTVNFTAPVAWADTGQLIVNECLQLPDYQNIFALGDMAATSAPATAQAAISQAEAVARNLRRAIRGKRLKKFTYKSQGQLISLGRWRAGGTIAGFTFSGRFAWWLWRTAYLFNLISWQKKLKVALDWTINLFSPRDISEL